MLSLFRAIFAPPRDLILVLLAAWIGLALADRRARKTPIGEKAFDVLVFVMLAAFALGGQLLAFAAHWAAFSSSPASILSLNKDLFDLWGGMASAAIAAAVVIQRKRLPAWQALDLLSVLLAALSVGLALSHLASGAAFGRTTDLPWAIQLWGARRHPTQVYELVAGLITFAAIWFWNAGVQPGRRFLWWLALTALGRLVIEGFRGDSTLLLGGVRLAQVVAWIVLAGALAVLELLQARGRKEPDAQFASPSLQ
jgi:prolipoprotein diacylglyceryltransferase